MVRKKRVKRKLLTAHEAWRLDLESLDITEINNLKVVTEDSIYVFSYLKWEDKDLFCILDASRRFYTFETIGNFPDYRFFYEKDVVLKGSLSEEFKVLKNILVPGRRLVLAQLNPKKDNAISFTSEKVKSILIRGSSWEYLLK